MPQLGLPSIGAFFVVKIITMFRFCIISMFLCLFSLDGFSTEVSGTIRSAINNDPLPFSSVLVKGSTKGASANNNGFYTISLDPGNYVLVFQYIGYQTVEQKITRYKSPANT